MAGGLRSVGFDRDSELLLVISASGKGVFDCRTGIKLARDSKDEDEDVVLLEAPGIGPLAGKTLRMSGLFGGGLPRGTRDGWRVELVEEPTFVMLYEPNAMLPRPADRSVYGRKLLIGEPVRAYGFSYTGKSLVIATPADITIYSRDSD